MGTHTDDMDPEKFFLSHTLGLLVQFDRGDGSPTGATSLTGCTVEIEDEWFLVTAGHIVKDLDAALAGGGRITQMLLFESHATDPISQQNPLPFNYDEARRTYVDDDGIDIAIIHLPALFRRNLEASGTRAFKMHEWLSPPEQPDAMVLTGYPDELTAKIEKSGRVDGMAVQAVILVLDPCEEPERMRSASHRYYGKLRPSPDMIKSVRGMSGGAVVGFALQADGSLRYGLMGIQSTWHPELKVLASTPFAPVGMAIAREYRRSLSESAALTSEVKP